MFVIRPRSRKKSPRLAKIIDTGERTGNDLPARRALRSLPSHCEPFFRRTLLVSYSATDHVRMMLVTGAAGKTGQALVKALVARGETVRALAFHPRHIPMLERLGAQEVVVADMRVPAQVDAALRGVEKLYHIGPNMHPQEVALGQNVIKAAQASGCAHIVYHSVLHPHTEGMPHHWLKLRVEEKLFESGLAFTILQPAAYLQNLLGGWAQILERGIYEVPYAAETRVSMVDLEEVAEVAAMVLTEPGHENATYALSGPEAPTQYEVAAILEQQLGRRVRVAVIPRQQWAANARKRGLGAYQVATLEKMFAYYEQYHFRGNATVLAALLGRKPTTLADFIARVIRQSSPA